MAWFRVDNRLVHGQVIEAWLPYTGARYLIVANDELAGNDLRQQIISLAVPQRIHTLFVTLEALPLALRSAPSAQSFVLLADCGDACRAFSQGVGMRALNIGNLHYAEGKRQIFPHIAVSERDIAQLAYLRDHDVELDFRAVPLDAVASSMAYGRLF